MNLLPPIFVIASLQLLPAGGARCWGCNLKKLHTELTKQYKALFKACDFKPPKSYRDVMKQERKSRKDESCASGSSETEASCNKLIDHLKSMQRNRGFGAQVGGKRLTTLIASMLGSDGTLALEGDGLFHALIGRRLRELLKFSLISAEFEITAQDLQDVIDGLSSVSAGGEEPVCLAGAGDRLMATGRN